MQRRLLFDAAFAAFTALAEAARTLASARLTTCFVAFWNWSNAAVEAANVDFRALTATSEPAGADWLAFSTQAAYAAPLILLAQNRQDDRDRANIDRDREVAARTQADTEFLARELAAVRLALSDVVTTKDLEDSMERMAKVIAEQLRDSPGDGASAGDPLGPQR